MSQPTDPQQSDQPDPLDVPILPVHDGQNDSSPDDTGGFAGGGEFGRPSDPESPDGPVVPPGDPSRDPQPFTQPESEPVPAPEPIAPEPVPEPSPSTEPVGPPSNDETIDHGAFSTEPSGDSGFDSGGGGSANEPV